MAPFMEPILALVLLLFYNALHYKMPSVVLYSDKVQALSYIQFTRQLVSCSADGGIAVWNMDVTREEVGGVIRSNNKSINGC